MQIALVTYPGLTATDLVGPYEVLRFLPDTDIRFVWHEIGPVVTDSGVLVLGATHTFDDTPRPDIVIVPGSTTDVAVAAGDERLRTWLTTVHETTTWTVSVCGGAMILAAAGLLTGRRATSHWQAMTPLRALGVDTCPDQRIVYDGKIVTSAGVSAGIDLAFSLAEQIAGRARAEAIQLMIEYEPQPPFDSGHYHSASASTKILANTLLTREALNGPHFAAATRLAWNSTLERVRTKKKSRVRA